jgi:hypothetical protein
MENASQTRTIDENGSQALFLSKCAGRKLFLNAVLFISPGLACCWEYPRYEKRNAESVDDRETFMGMDKYTRSTTHPHTHTHRERERLHKFST